MNDYKDPSDPGNSTEHHTGEVCVEHGCNEPAGTAWSPVWCFACNVKRMERVTAGFASVLAGFEKEPTDD